MSEKKCDASLTNHVWEEVWCLFNQRCLRRVNPQQRVKESDKVITLDFQLDWIRFIKKLTYNLLKESWIFSIEKKMFNYFLVWLIDSCLSEIYSNLTLHSGKNKSSNYYLTNISHFKFQVCPQQRSISRSVLYMLNTRFWLRTLTNHLWIHKVFTLYCYLTY